MCAACHRTLGDSTKHLGKDLLPLAKSWVEECRLPNAELPSAVVEDFEPSALCLCTRDDCFYAGLREHKREMGSRRCIPCGSQATSKWRKAGSLYPQYHLFFSEGGGSDNTEVHMAATKEVITAESWICNACYTSFMKHAARGWRPSLEALLATPAETTLRQGRAQSVARTVRVVQEALARGDFVCSEDVERSLHQALTEDGLKAASTVNTRQTVREVMKGVADCVRDVEMREYQGASFGEDGRTNFIYLAVVPVHLDSVVALHRKMMKKNAEIDELKRQLREARGGVDVEVPSGDASGVPPRSALDRLERVKIAAGIVREDIVAATTLRNVRRGRTWADDNARTLQPIGEYVEHLPQTLREMMHRAFDLDMGFAPATPVAPSDNTATRHRDEARDGKRSVNTRNLGYFVATMCVKSLLGGGSYRAPHEMMLAQALKSHGSSRQVIDFCAMLGLCTTDSGLFLREDMFVQNYLDEERIPLDLSVVAVAWDNNDMHAVMNLDGAQHIAFCAATSVGIADPKLRLSSEDDWDPVTEVDDTMILQGRVRDDDNNVFAAWEEVLMRSAWACATSGKQDEETCLEVELRKVSLKVVKCPVILHSTGMHERHRLSFIVCICSMPSVATACIVRDRPNDSPSNI